MQQDDRWWEMYISIVSAISSRKFVPTGRARALDGNYEDTSPELDISDDELDLAKCLATRAIRFAEK